MSEETIDGMRRPGNLGPIKMFDIKLAEKVLEYGKKFKPFDSVCARMEFRDKLEAAEREAERIHGYVKEDALKVEIGDLDKYGDEDRFELIEDQEEAKDILQDGMKKSVIFGHTIAYRCKKRGHGIANFIPIEDYNRLNTKKKKEE